MKLGPCAVHRMSFPVIHEMLGEYSPQFYELRTQLFAAGTREAMQAFEVGLKGRLGALPEREAQKLRLIVTRRWKLLA